MKLDPGKNIRLFRNPLLENLSYVHPIMPLLLWLPIITFCLAYGIQNESISTYDSLKFFAIGVFVWTLAEYVLHRFVFHFVPKTPRQERLVYLFHGIHHDDPDDQRRLLMPPAAAILQASILYVLFYGLLGSTLVNPFFSGFLVGYLLYDYIHFATHYVKFLNEGIFKKLKANHMKHHYSKDHINYGVSSPLWDYLFNSKAK